MDYIGTGRSNYIKVTDMDRVKKLADDYCLRVNEKEGMVSFLSLNESGEYNDYTYDEESGEEIELPNFMEEVAEVMDDDQVFIWMHSGNEGYRYLGGDATAINKKKQFVAIGLSDIYDLVQTRFGIKPTKCEY